ncbi:hypothetical protein BFJ70_g16627 [Fusarium oxysporum]|nr:hypothetical protein BFJ70_g16627 [Fusarium oxysporum]
MLDIEAVALADATSTAATSEDMEMTVAMNSGARGLRMRKAIWTISKCLAAGLRMITCSGSGCSYIGPNVTSNFTEGVYVDYRHFDKLNIEPRYEFGFGLSYTTYNYGNLQIEKICGANITAYPTGPVMEGGQADLWDTLIKVTADIANVGQMDGAEAAQLYVGIPGAPLRQLRGFTKPFIKAGETMPVHFELTRRDLSVWDTVGQNWLLQSGDYAIFIGASSRILPLEAKVAF